MSQLIIEEGDSNLIEEIAEILFPFVPLVAPFLIGLLSGFIVKRTIKLLFAVVALLIVLSVTGFLTIVDVEAFFMYIPKIVDLGGGILDIIPYTATTFLIGLGIGLLI